MKRLGLVALLSSAAAFALPSGHKWFPARIPVHYSVFAHTTINGMPANSFNTAVLPRVQEAFLTWTSTRVACTAWRSQYDGTFSTPANYSPQSDMQNRVIWLGGANWHYSASTLGLTTTWFFTNGEIVDADMEMNNNVTWANTFASSSVNAFDYESVVLHEAGHFLGLEHTPAVSAAVMFPNTANAEIKRTLTPSDVNDVCGVYPGTGMGTQGNPCTMQNQCTNGLVCRTKQGSTAGKICTVDCSSNMGACSTVTPLTCQAADTGMACLPPGAATDYCKFCVDGADCSSGNCITDGSGHNWCTNSCSPSAPCPSGSVCLDVMVGGSCANVTGQGCICAPTPTAQGVKCPGQCTGSTCGTTPGYICSTGTCEARGNEGDRCELHGRCDTCLICIGTTAAATCRRCCGGNGMGGACNTCPAATCAAMDQCVGIQNSNDKICYPTGGADLCQPCGGTTGCINGNTCVGGSCHASCNPQSPGTCGACLPTSATTGVCACSGEERGVGESCGGASAVAACRTGLVCSGGVCRTQCVVGNTASCPSGEVCQNVGGAAVCVASTSGSRCAACNGVSCAPGNTCYQGRCYTTCNVNVKPGPCDYSCVDVGGGVNLCACDDQIGGSGATCGANPIAACGDRLLCIGGVCRGECNPNVVNACDILNECKLLPGSQFTFVCQPISSTGTGGGGGSNNNPLDCTPAGSVCPNDTSCVPNGDGTATCRPMGQTCDPNGSTNTCPTDTLCRAVDGQPGTYRCQLPAVGNNGGCGCSNAAGGVLVALAMMLLRRRR